MIKKNDLLKNLNEENVEKSPLVKRLLNEEELSMVSGGADYAQCGGDNPGHSQTGSGGYTQGSGSGYTQSGAGDYTQTCPPGGENAVYNGGT